MLVSLHGLASGAFGIAFSKQKQQFEFLVTTQACLRYSVHTKIRIADPSARKSVYMGGQRWNRVPCL